MNADSKKIEEIHQWKIWWKKRINLPDSEVRIQILNGSYLAPKEMGGELTLSKAHLMVVMSAYYSYLLRISSPSYEARLKKAIEYLGISMRSLQEDVRRYEKIFDQLNIEIPDGGNYGLQ